MESIQHNYAMMYLEHLAETKPAMLRRMAKDEPDELIKILAAKVATGKRLEAYYQKQGFQEDEVQELVNAVLCPVEDEVSSNPMGMTTSEKIYKQLVNRERINAIGHKGGKQHHFAG